MFNQFFTSYQSTDSPPIETQDYIDNSNKLQTINISSIQEKLSKLLTKNFNIPDPVPISDYINVNFSQDNSSKNNSKVKDSPTKMSTLKEYVDTMYYHLYNALENNGLDGKLWAPTLVAQTSIESGWGNVFSRKHNNYGGIKGEGSGKVKTKEWSPSRGYYIINDSFKHYDSIADFADDYVKKLKNKFNAFKNTPKEYVRNIRSKGYFTDSLENYLSMMDSRIKRINKLLS